METDNSTFHEVNSLSIKYNVPESFVKRNLYSYRLRERVDNFDTFAKANPKLAKYFLQDPTRMAIFNDNREEIEKAVDRHNELLRPLSFGDAFLKGGPLAYYNFMKQVNLLRAGFNAIQGDAEDIADSMITAKDYQAKANRTLENVPYEYQNYLLRDSKRGELQDEFTDAALDELGELFADDAIFEWSKFKIDSANSLMLGFDSIAETLTDPRIALFQLMQNINTLVAASVGAGVGGYMAKKLSAKAVSHLVPYAFFGKRLSYQALGAFLGQAGGRAIGEGGFELEDALDRQGYKIDDTDKAVEALTHPEVRNTVLTSSAASVAGRVVLDSLMDVGIGYGLVHLNKRIVRSRLETAMKAGATAQEQLVSRMKTAGLQGSSILAGALLGGLSEGLEESAAQLIQMSIAGGGFSISQITKEMAQGIPTSGAMSSFVVGLSTIDTTLKSAAVFSEAAIKATKGQKKQFDEINAAAELREKLNEEIVAAKTSEIAKNEDTYKSMKEEGSRDVVFQKSDVDSLFALEESIKSDSKTKVEEIMAALEAVSKDGVNFDEDGQIIVDSRDLALIVKDYSETDINLIIDTIEHESGVLLGEVDGKLARTYKTMLTVQQGLQRALQERQREKVARAKAAQSIDKIVRQQFKAAGRTTTEAEVQ